MRKYFTAFFFLISLVIPQNRLEDIYSANKSKDFLKNALWSVYAKYVKSGEELLNINGNMSLAPASGLKLLTSAAAIEILGSDYRFTTGIYSDDGISPEGILEGSIYLAGGGDPTLGSSLVKGSADLDELMNTLTTAVRASGIKEIRGNIYADDFYFDRIPIPDNWYWIDLGNYYSAQSSALTINDNLYYLFLKPGKKAGDNTEFLRIEPEVPGLKFENHILTGEPGSGDNGYIYCAPNQYDAVLRGTIPAGHDEFSIKGSIPDPALFAVLYLKKSLESAGIKVSGEAAKLAMPVDYTEKKLVRSIQSPPLSEIIYILNKRSNNLFTEQLLRTVAVHKGKSGGFYEGIEVLEEFLDSLGIDRSALQLYDGCGLSRSNMISSEILAELLIKMTASRYFEDYYGSLAVAGDPDDIGYFSRYGKGTKVAFNARIKSGLIDRVRSHSGYITDSSGNLIAFSFIANNFKGSSGKIDLVHLELLKALSELNQ